MITAPGTKKTIHSSTIASIKTDLIKAIGTLTVIASEIELNQPMISNSIMINVCTLKTALKSISK